jgi:dihydroxyacetone kinase
MTKIFNDPSDFAAETSAGFVRAFPTLVEQVPGGVRTAAPTPGKVAVVIGGGSGHYPAFAGWVGPGLADRVAVGSPGGLSRDGGPGRRWAATDLWQLCR